MGDDPLRQHFILYEKNFGWLVNWELNWGRLGLLWLVASVTWWGIILAEDLHDGSRWTMSLLNYTMAFALQLRKNMEVLSQGSRGIRKHSFHKLGCIFMDSFWLACWESVLLSYPWMTSASPWGTQHYLTLSYNSQLVPWCGQQRVEFACYLFTKLH
jgi:hypothetical protein